MNKCLFKNRFLKPYFALLNLSGKLLTNNANLITLFIYRQNESYVELTIIRF